jgi:hypothetical protein
MKMPATRCHSAPISLIAAKIIAATTIMAMGADVPAPKPRPTMGMHVARHPEDVGRTVADFNWILQEIVRSFRGWHNDPQCAAGIETSGDD